VVSPVDSEGYVGKYAVSGRNRVLTSVGEDFGAVIGDLEEKLLKTLDSIPKVLAKGDSR